MKEQSCGCKKGNDDMKKDLTGWKFGKLTAKEGVLKDLSGNALYKCHCECGNDIYASAEALLKGELKSCGCDEKPGELKVEKKSSSEKHEELKRLKNALYEETSVSAPYYKAKIYAGEDCNEFNNPEAEALKAKWETDLEELAQEMMMKVYARIYEAAKKFVSKYEEYEGKK